MARFLSFFAKNKILEDKLNKREDKLRQDHKYVLFRHSEITSRLVKDLVHIHIKTPGLPISDSASENQVRSESTELPSLQAFQTTRQSQTVGTKMKPMNYFPYKDVTNMSSLCDRKLRDHATPRVEIRDNKVFYKYKCLQWKKLSPSKKTHILLHKNNSVERILHRVNKMDSSALNRGQQESANMNQDTALLGKENRVNEHRHCITDDKEFDPEVVRLPAIEGNAIRSFCLWRRESQPPVWIYRKSNGPDRFYTPGRSMTTMN